MTSTLLTCTSSTRPASPSAGDTLFETDTNKIIVYSGSDWKLYDSDGTGGYNLDGTNILAATPLLHLDASKINGTDTSANPSSGASLTTVWASKVSGTATLAQGTAANQPTWNSSGTSSQPYISSDGGDELFMDFRTDKLGPISGPFTIMGVMQRVGATSFSMGGQVSEPLTATPSPIWSTSPFWSFSSVDYMYYQQTGADNASPPTFASGSGNSSTAVAAYTVTRLFMVTRDASNNTRIYVDGNNTNTDNVGTFSGDLVMSSLWRGYSSSYLSTGHTYEIALWDSDLSVADKNKIITYTNTRYGSGRNADDTDDLARATF